MKLAPVVRMTAYAPNYQCRFLVDAQSVDDNGLPVVMLDGWRVSLVTSRDSDNPAHNGQYLHWSGVYVARPIMCTTRKLLDAVLEQLKARDVISPIPDPVQKL